MKILLCHNHYQQAGGEDQVFSDEAQLLERYGHGVIRYTVHNDAIERMGRLEVAKKTIWNRSSYRDIRRLVQRELPDVVHFTNTFPLISPAAYYAVRREGVPIIQSLHNYRLLCPSACFYRNDSPCEDCLGKKLPWPAIQHGCYRSSRLASSVVASMNAVHQTMGTWRKCIDTFIALSNFSASKFVEGGLPAEKIVVKRNFIESDPGMKAGNGGYAVFVGRLAPEKGLATLLDAWDRLDGRMRLKIVGTGPLEPMVQERCKHNSYVTHLGHQSIDEVMRIVGDAACLILPSMLYENCPKTLIEAMAVGTPVVASRLGAIAEMVEHEKTGLLFSPGDSSDLAEAIMRLTTSEKLLSEMRSAARLHFEQHYTPELNYQQLMNIYTQFPRTATRDARLAPSIGASTVTERFAPTNQLS